MQILGLTEGASRRKQLELKKLGKLALNIFIVTLLLPIIVYILFYYGIISSSGRSADASFEAAIALVQTPTGLSGTAFIVGESTLLTACHVVEGLETGTVVTLLFDKADPPINTTALLSWKDKNYSLDPAITKYGSDLAVLKLVNPTEVPEDYVPRLTFGDSDEISNGTDVLSVGYPDGEYLLAPGAISNTSYMDYDFVFQTTADAYPGNSGGPLLLKDSKDVIGMMLFVRTGEFAGINFANKINNIDNILYSNGIDYSE
mgnify:CR=1 FL=1